MYNNFKEYSKQWDVDRSWDNNPSMGAYYDMANVYGIQDQPQMSQYDAVFFGRPGKSTEMANDLKYGYQHGKEAGRLGWSYSQYRDLSTTNVSDMYENKLTKLYGSQLGFPEKQPYPELYNQAYVNPDDYFLGNGVFDYKRYNEDNLKNLRQAQSLYAGSTSLSNMTSSLADLYSSDATFGEKVGGTVGTLFDTKAGRAIGGNAETGERGTLERILGVAGIPHAIVVGGIGALTDGDDDTGFLEGAWKSFKNVQPLNKYRDEEATRGMSDLLDQWGWKSTGETDLFSVDTWNVNDIARTLVSFGGDILLDPLTYFSVGADDLVLGSGETKKIKATTVDEATKYLTSIDQVATKEAIYDVMGELDSIKGIRKGKGVTFGFDRVPLVGKKLDQMVGGRKELLSPEVTMAMGDKLFAPNINSLLDDMKTTGLFTSVSSKNQALKRVLENEALVGKEIALAQSSSRELFNSLQNISRDSQYADEFLSKLSPEDQANVINVIFNPNYMDDAFEESLSQMYNEGFKDIRNKFFGGKADDSDAMMKILDGFDLSYGPSTEVLSFENKQRKYFEKMLADSVEENFTNLKKFNDYRFESYDEFMEVMSVMDRRTRIFDHDYVEKYLKDVEFQDFYNELTEYTAYMNGNSTVLSPEIRGVVKDVWAENQKFAQEMFETNGMGTEMYKAFERSAKVLEDKRNVMYLSDMVPEQMGLYNTLYESKGQYEADKFLEWNNRYGKGPTPNIGNLENGESIKYMTQVNLASGPDGLFANKFVDDFNRSLEHTKRFELSGYDLGRYEKMTAKGTITDGSKFVVNGTELDSKEFAHMIEKKRITNTGEYIKPPTKSTQRVSITPEAPSAPVQASVNVVDNTPNTDMINIVNYQSPKLTKITSEADVTDYIDEYRTLMIDKKFNATDRALPTVNGFKARIDKSPQMNTTLSRYDKDGIKDLVSGAMGENREKLMTFAAYNNLPEYQTNELIDALNNIFFASDKPVIDGNTSRKSIEKMYRDIYDNKQQNVISQLTEYGGYYDGTFSYANRVLGKDYHYGSRHNTTYQEKFVERLAKQKRELNGMLNEWSEEALKLQKEGITDVAAYNVLKPDGFDKALERYESLTYDISVHDAQLALMMKERKIPYDSGFLDTTEYNIGNYGNVNLKYGPTIGADKTVTPSDTRTLMGDKYFGTNRVDPNFEDVIMGLNQEAGIADNMIDLVDGYDPLYIERANKLAKEQVGYDGFTFEDFFGEKLTPEQQKYNEFKEFATKNSNFSYAMKSGVPLDELFEADNQYFYTNNFIDKKYYDMFGKELKDNPDMVRTMVQAYGGNPEQYVSPVPNLELKVLIDDFDKNITNGDLLLPAPVERVSSKPKSTLITPDVIHVDEPLGLPAPRERGSISTIDTPDVIYAEFDSNSPYNMKMRGIKADRLNRMEQDLYDYRTTLLPQLTVDNFHAELDKVGNMGVDKYYEKLATRNEMLADVSGLNGFSVALNKGDDISSINKPLAEWDLSKNLYLNRDVNMEQSVLNDIASDMFSVDSSFDIYMNGEMIDVTSRDNIDRLTDKFNSKYAVKGDMLVNKTSGRALYKLPDENVIGLALEDAYSGGVTAKLRENMQILAEADDVFHVEEAYKVIENFIGEESARTILPKYHEILEDFSITKNRMIEDFNGVYSQEVRDTAAGILKRYHRDSYVDIDVDIDRLKEGIPYELEKIKSESLKDLNKTQSRNVYDYAVPSEQRKKLLNTFDSADFYDMLEMYEDGQLDDFIIDSIMAKKMNSRPLDDLDDYLLTIGEPENPMFKLAEEFEPVSYDMKASNVSASRSFDVAEELHKDAAELHDYVDGYLRILATDEGNAFMDKMNSLDFNESFDSLTTFNREVFNNNMDKGANYFHLMRNDRSIEEINKALYEAIGIEEFFETDLSRQFVKHSIKTNRTLYQDDIISEFVTKFAQNGGSKYIKDTDIAFIPSRDLIRTVGFGDSASHELIKELGLQDVYDRGYLPPLIQLTEDQAQNLMGVKAPVSYAPRSSFDVMVKSQLAQYRQDTNAFLNIYDKFLNVYKVNTTAVNPGFHTRNKMGNVWQNYLDIGAEAYSMENFITARDIIKGKEGTLDGTHYSYEDVRNLIKSHQVLDTGFWDADAGISLGDITKGGTLNPLDTANFAPYKLGGWVGGNIEGQDRVINYITHLKNGASPASALHSVNKYLFDYSDLTVFETQFMRRVMPFYTWQRKNIPLQLSMLNEKPEIFSRVNHAINAIESLVAEEDRLEREYMASWTDDWVQLPGSYTNEEGRKESIIFNPNLPYGDVGGIVSNKADLFNMLTPAIKLPYELIANRNVFFDSPIVKYEGHTVDMPEVFRRPAGIGSNDEEPTQISPKVRHLLNYFVPLNNLNNIMEAEGKDKTHKMMRTLTGLSASTYDGDKYKRYMIEQRLRELNEDARERQFGR